MNLNIWADFQICISVPLSASERSHLVLSKIAMDYWILSDH